MNIYNGKQLITSSKIMIYRSVIGSGLLTANIVRVLMSITCPMVHISAAGIMKKVVTCCFKSSRCPSGISNSTAVCAKDVSHWLVSGEHSLIYSCGSISHHLCLLVSWIQCYHSPILPPCDSGSRPTSGGAGEGPGSFIIPQCGNSGCSWNRESWPGWISLVVVNLRSIHATISWSFGEALWEAMACGSILCTYINSVNL